MRVSLGPMNVALLIYLGNALFESKGRGVKLLTLEAVASICF